MCNLFCEIHLRRRNVEGVQDLHPEAYRRSSHIILSVASFDVNWHCLPIKTSCSMLADTMVLIIL